METTSIFSNTTLWTILFFLIPTAFGVPIAISMGTAAVAIAWMCDLGVQMISFNFFANIAKFPLLAIPFFILAGMIMEKSGIATRLITFIKECVGAMTGGFAIAAVAVATFWGALSGSGPATVAALGVILIPGMEKTGYDKAFSTATVAVSSGLAIIIPPSIGFIIYAMLTGCSVGAIFAAGIIPGIVMAVCLMTSVWLTSRKHGWKGEPRSGNFFKAFKEAGWALFSPVIILGGIYGGICTPTEAAAVAVFYGLFVGVFIYKEITWKVLYDVLATSAAASGVVMLLVTCGGLYAWTATTVGMIDKMGQIILGISNQSIIVLLTLNVVLFVMGMIVDGVSLYYVFTPLLWPIIQHFGWDPVWFGVMMTMNIALGAVTPPVAGNLFVASRIAGLTMEDLMPWLPSLIVASVIALALVVGFPQLSLFLPKLWGLM